MSHVIRHEGEMVEATPRCSHVDNRQGRVRIDLRTRLDIRTIHGPDSDLGLMCHGKAGDTNNTHVLLLVYDSKNIITIGSIRRTYSQSSGSLESRTLAT